MNEPVKFNNLIIFLWAIAKLLNAAFEKSQVQKIMQPCIALGQLCRTMGYAFHNTSKFITKACRGDAEYLMGFSPNIRMIFNATTRVGYPN